MVAVLTVCVLTVISWGLVVAVARVARAASDALYVLRRHGITAGAARARTGLAGVVHGHLPHRS
ncbi:MAG: hypothetical protein ABW075_01415 [Aeromicrobium sp.]